MEQISYQTLEKCGYEGYILKAAPEKVMQFGEGNFLRAFADYWFDIANEKAGWNGKCAIVQPIPTGLSDMLNRQEGLYTLYLRGMEKGKIISEKRVISSVSRCINPYTAKGWQETLKLAQSEALEYIVSNTTEAGIVYDPSCKKDDAPCASFPGKLTQVLYHRFLAGKKGLVILSCELIDENGRELQKCVLKYAALWQLEEAFIRYIQEDCLFCSTLVDRIVPGRIRDAEERNRMEQENGYIDELMDVGEIFGVWNIEGPKWLEEKLPFQKAGLNCIVVPDVTPYKQRKVRILNGAHTGFVLGSFLAGFNIVRQCMEDETVGAFMQKMLYEEVIPTLPLDKADLEDFAAAVADRFRNPFVDHALLSISLNSTSKWRARNLPSLLEYVALRGKLPRCLTMSFASYIAFYSQDVQGLSGEGLICRRKGGEEYCCKDDPWVLAFFADHAGEGIETLTRLVMQNERMWGQDLTKIPGFEKETIRLLHCIREQGPLAAMKACL